MIFIFLQWWCQILHVVLHYFLLTNYAWMLAEGFYLHTLLVFAFTSEDTLVRWSWTLAWSTPLVVISLYTLLRISNDHTSEWVKKCNLYLNIERIFLFYNTYILTCLLLSQIVHIEIWQFFFIWTIRLGTFYWFL